jgi:hypothetical protein
VPCSGEKQAGHTFLLEFFYYVLFYMISVFQILEKGEGKV